MEFCEDYKKDQNLYRNLHFRRGNIPAGENIMATFENISPFFYNKEVADKRPLVLVGMLVGWLFWV